MARPTGLEPDLISHGLRGRGPAINSSNSSGESTPGGRNRPQGRGPKFGSSPPATGGRTTGDGEFNSVTSQLLGDGSYEAVATAKRDWLTGLGPEDSATTIFTWPALSDSILKGPKRRALWDEVTNFSSERDVINAPEAIGSTTITGLSGRINKLVPGQINAKGVGAETFSANSAAAFTCKGYAGTFIVLNNGTPGYQHRKDSLIYLRDFSFGQGAEEAGINII